MAARRAHTAASRVVSYRSATSDWFKLHHGLLSLDWLDRLASMARLPSMAWYSNLMAGGTHTTTRRYRVDWSSWTRITARGYCADDMVRFAPEPLVGSYCIHLDLCSRGFPPNLSPQQHPSRNLCR